MHTILNILNDTDGIDVKIKPKDKLRRRKKTIKSVKVAPFVKHKNAYIDAPHPNLLRMPFSLLVFARKGSGKTILVQNILTYYFSLFDNVFIFSPTITLDFAWKELLKKLDIPEENIYTRYSETVLNSILQQIKDINGVKDMKDIDMTHTLIIFDDIIESLPKNKKVSVINKLAFNHRHYKLSHIIVSQSYKKVDCNLRSNTTGVILFQTDNIAERLKIMEELAGNIGMREFEKLWYNCCKEQYGFMFINYDPNKRNIYQNFDRVIADLDTAPKFLFDK